MSKEKDTISKGPMSSGKKGEWTYFKSQFKAFLNLKGHGETLTYEDEIESIATTLTQDELKQAENKKAKRMREMNSSDKPPLLGSMDRNTELGKVAFGIVSGHQTSGFPLPKQQLGNWIVVTI